jgi:endonuclease YncB( thermonuclease family)
VLIDRVSTLSIPMPSWFWTTPNEETKRPTPKERLQHLQSLPLYSPQIIIPTLLLTTSLLSLHTFYRRRLRRIPTVPQLPPAAISSHQTLFGKAVSVGDADNFRLFHTPGGRLLGWGWLRHIPTARKDLTKAGTLHIRLAGIDAPEGAHFGNAAQPYAVEAQAWLTNYVLGKRVRVTLLARDRYERVVCSVKVWRWGFRRDVSLEMAKAGWAEVYDNAGAEYGGLERDIRKAVEVAQYVFIGDDMLMVDDRNGGCGLRI